MKRLLSLLLISSFACGMEPDEGPATKRKEQNYPAHVYIQQLIQDKIKEGKLKNPENCFFDEAIEQLNLIVSSLRFGKDKNYYLNQEEIKAKEQTAGLCDLMILQAAFDQVITKLLHHDGQVKKQVDLLVETLKNPAQKRAINKISVLHPVIKKYIYHHLLIYKLGNLFDQSEYMIKGVRTNFPYKNYFIFYQSKKYNLPQSRFPQLWNNSIIIDGPSPQIIIKDFKPITSYVPIEETNFILAFTEDTIKFWNVFDGRNIFSLYLNKKNNSTLDSALEKNTNEKTHTLSNEQVFNFFHAIHNNIDWSRL